VADVDLVEAASAFANMDSDLTAESAADALAGRL
jgi:hypothetical protein